MRLGILARCDATGLGMHTQDWVNHLPIDKVLVVWGQKKFQPKIYAHKEMLVTEHGNPSLKEIDWLLEGIDVVLTIETPYNWSLISKAREKGVKSVIAPNYEWIPKLVPEQPDLWLCYNPLTPDYVPFPNKVYLPQPIDIKQFKFKKRKKAKTFLFNNGNGGVHGRNSVNEFIQAIPFIKSDIKIIINSQVPIQPVNDKRVQVNIGDQPLEDIWKEGDVFIHIRKFGANSLPINEAMAQGMPIIGMNRKPENLLIPKKFLIQPSGIRPLECREDVRPVDACLIDPRKIAEKIDEIANTDISEDSKKIRKQAEELSWDKQLTDWITVLNNLCSSPSDNQKLAIEK